MASVFHHRGWLEALARTYGYEPLAVTTSSPDERLQNGIVFCRISSWLTGTRLVSLPFSDHCDPLINGAGNDLICELWTSIVDRRCEYLEMRPLVRFDGAAVGMKETSSFCFHMLDLRDELPRIFQRFHRNSIQRKIQRAERERLS